AARAPARARLVGGRARTLEVEIDEGADLGLERGDIGKAAFEEVARRVDAAGKARRRREGRLGGKLQFLVRRQHGDGLRSSFHSALCFFLAFVVIMVHRFQEWSGSIIVVPSSPSIWYSCYRSASGGFLGKHRFVSPLFPQPEPTAEVLS